MFHNIKDIVDPHICSKCMYCNSFGQRIPRIEGIWCDSPKSTCHNLKRMAAIGDHQTVYRNYDLGKSASSKESMISYMYAKHPLIKNVIFNNPATIVFWEDDTKTIVKCLDGEKYDKEKGLAIAISKKVFGNSGSYYDEFKKWCGEQASYGKEETTDEENS